MEMGVRHKTQVIVVNVGGRRAYVTNHLPHAFTPLLPTQLHSSALFLCMSLQLKIKLNRHTAVCLFFNYLNVILYSSLSCRLKKNCK